MSMKDEETDPEAAAQRLLHELDGPAPAEAGRFGQVIDWIGPYVSWLFLVSMVIIFFEVVMRYVFNSPTIWVHETTTFLTGICFIYGGAYCLARDRHIRVVLIYDAVPTHVRRWLDLVISIIGFISACFLSYAAWTVVVRALFDPAGRIRLERTGSAWNPPYPAILKTFLLVMLIVIAIQFLILAINYWRRNTRAWHSPDD